MIRDITELPVAVTGGSGFIGSEVIRQLRRDGWQVRNVDLEVGVDLLGPYLADVLHGCWKVIHLGGVLGTSELYDDPERAVDVNVKGTLRVLDVCSRFGVGLVNVAILNVWDNMYAITKRTAERLSQAWHRDFGVPLSLVRANNVFGPGQKWGPGDPQKIVPTFARAAWAGEPIPIWDTGEQEVDLIHVRDAAAVFVAALGYDDGEEFDAGTGVGQRVIDVASRVLEITGSDAGVRYLGEHAGERHDHHPNLVAGGAGWDLLGWAPEYRDRDLVETVEWYRDHTF